MRNICRNPSYLPSQKMWVDCGHCYACRLKKRGEWIMRLEHEFYDKNHDALFVTLTYDETHCPRRWVESVNHDTGEVGLCLVPTLLKRDIQKFLKRLRKDLSGSKRPVKFKYFICGEYGPRTQRPHYHLVLIGLDMSHETNIIRAWRMCDPFVGYDIKPISSKKAIAYVTGYTGKKIGIKYNKRHKDIYGRDPEFQLTSSHIGLDYLEKLSKEDPRIMSEGKLYKDGVGVILPRTYRRQLGLEGEMYKDDIFSRQKQTVEHVMKCFPEHHGVIGQVRALVTVDSKYVYGGYHVTDHFYNKLKELRKLCNLSLENRFKNSKRERGKL